MRTQNNKCEYDNDGERITQPGKFEGEPVFAPYFWELGLQGMSDSDDGRTYTFKFKTNDPELNDWPTLKQWFGRKRTLRLSEDSTGFVHCF